MIVIYNDGTMDVRDLEIFLSVAKHLHFTRAGDEVHLSQPSISVRIRKLEDELNIKLFEQVGKRVALTEAGKLLVPYAHRAIAALDDARHAVEELQGLERGSLRIGASTTPGMYLVPKFVARFKRQYPKIEISLEIKDTRQIEEAIIRNEFDFGFVGGHLVGTEAEIIPWLTDEIVLVAPPRHPLTKKKQVRLPDLKSEQFISREQGSATQAAVNDKLRFSGLQLETVMEMNNPEAVKKAVQSGLGVAFISIFAVETELKAKTLMVVRVKDLGLSRELKIVHRKDKHLSRAAQAFIKMCGIT
jgi:DNA-binding transcriptional LysR family regulator